MFGTRSVREPSFFCTSTAIPSRTLSRWMRWGCPSTSAYASFIRGNASNARRIAHATMWVKLTFVWPVDSRCLLRRRRFSSSVRTGIVRTDVAVGIWRLASMFSTMRTAPPRIGWRMSPGSTDTRATAVERPPAEACGSVRASVCRPWPAGGAPGSAVCVSAGMTVTAGASVRAAAAAAVSLTGAAPVATSKYVRQPASTLSRSCRYCSRRSRAKT